MRDIVVQDVRLHAHFRAVCHGWGGPGLLHLARKHSVLHTYAFSYSSAAVLTCTRSTTTAKRWPTEHAGVHDRARRAQVEDAGDHFKSSRIGGVKVGFWQSRLTLHVYRFGVGKRLTTRGPDLRDMQRMLMQRHRIGSPDHRQRHEGRAGPKRK